MKSNKRVFALLMAGFVALTWPGFAQGPTTAKDPVCGMTVKKEGAKFTFDYKGTTYYFCGLGCQTEFSKNPEKYRSKDAAPALAGMHAQMVVGHKMEMDGCPFMSADVDKKIENTKDGLTITLSSKKAELVKKLQEQAAMIKAGKRPMMDAKGGASASAKEAECAGGCCSKKEDRYYRPRPGIGILGRGFF